MKKTTFHIGRYFATLLRKILHWFLAKNNTAKFRPVQVKFFILIGFPNGLSFISFGNWYFIQFSLL